MKCPACGFETPDTQDWCDFCKEPLRKRKAADASRARPEPAPEAGPPAAAVPGPGPSGAADPAAAAKSVPVPDEVWKRLMAVRAGAPEVGTQASTPGADIPPEFAGLDTGGSVPPVPPLVRQGAWVFLGICVLWIFAAVVWMIRNSDRIAANVSAAAPLPVHAEAPPPADAPEASPPEVPSADAQP